MFEQKQKLIYTICLPDVREIIATIHKRYSEIHALELNVEFLTLLQETAQSADDFYKYKAFIKAE